MILLWRQRSVSSTREQRTSRQFKDAFVKRRNVLFFLNQGFNWRQLKRCYKFSLKKSIIWDSSAALDIMRIFPTLSQKNDLSHPTSYTENRFIIGYSRWNWKSQTIPKNLVWYLWNIPMPVVINWKASLEQAHCVIAGCLRGLWEKVSLNTLTFPSGIATWTKFW